MESRRGISTTVALVAVVIAVLGTSVYFLQGDSLNAFLGDIAGTLADQQSSAQEQSGFPAEAQDAAEQVEPVSEPAGAQQECEALSITSQPLQSGEECLKVFNARTWANENGGSATINERSTTSFVVENTGAKTITITSIYLRTVPVPVQDWFSTKDPVITKPANVQHELPVDYKETAVLIGGSLAIMEPGTITLEPGQLAIVYLNEAGGVTEKDAGLSLVLQVQTASIQAITPVPVVAS